MKPASSRWVHSVRHLPLRQNLGHSLSGVGYGYGLEQSLRVWMFWVCEDVLAWSDLDDSAYVHYCDSIAEEFCCCQIVCYENVGEIVFGSEVQHKLQNFCFVGISKICPGLSAYNELGLQDKTR